jgi:N-acetylneuraminate synthase
MQSTIQIANKTIGAEQRTLVIAEVAQAHDGSLGMAHAFIDAIADAGADAVKFQTHIAHAESTHAETWRVKFSPQDATRYDYWRRMEFTKEQWQGLKNHADERKLIFLSSPFSIEAVELLSQVGVGAWKVASGELNNSLLFERLVHTRLPILLSTGMSSLSEVDTAVALVKNSGLPLAVFQCTSMYPTPPEKVGLNMIPFFRKRYGCAVGLSDHSGTIYAGLAAAALDIDLLEVHVTFSRQMFGPDVSSSVTIEELKQLVEGILFINKMGAMPVEKDLVANELISVRQLFTKSVVARMDLQAGTVLKEKHLTVKKPGTGISAGEIKLVIGRRLKRAVLRNQLLSWKDLEEPIE